MRRSHLRLRRTIVIDGEPDLRFPLIWMAACAVLPMLVFLMPVAEGKESLTGEAGVN